MRFLKIKCLGTFNSYRQPDFHTYHKTLPLPPKTTIGGFIGSALGISPFEVNEEWLKNDRFMVGIVGFNKGEANDLWQIRKYENKQIKSYQLGSENSPYKTAVIVREILFRSFVTLYLAFSNEKDYAKIKEALNMPRWALSLGREDELVKITDIVDVELKSINGEHKFRNTVLQGDMSTLKYKPMVEESISGNLLKKAPKSVNLPTAFSMKEGSEVRQGCDYITFTYIGELPVLLTGEAYYDEKDDVFFQTI